MTLIDRAHELIELASASAATLQTSAHAATLTSTLSAMQQAESTLVEMSGLLVALHDDAGQKRARVESKVARECVARLLGKRSDDERWQGVVLENPDEVNELVRRVRDASGHYQREAITAWQLVSERAKRHGGGSTAALEALGGKFKQRAARAKQAQDELRNALATIGADTPTPVQATEILEKIDNASAALEEALRLIPDDAIRDGLARAMGAYGLPLDEADELLAWIGAERLEGSFSIHLS